MIKYHIKDHKEGTHCSIFQRTARKVKVTRTECASKRTGRNEVREMIQGEDICLNMVFYSK